MSSNHEKLKQDVKAVVASLAQRLGSVELDHYTKARADGPFLVFEVANAHNRFFRMLEVALEDLDKDNFFKDRTTISARKKFPKDRLGLPETQLLRETVSESLTIDRHSFEDDFFSRYTASVTAFEKLIATNANFIVYGRRGSGKSSLLAYGMHILKRRQTPFVWVAMQTYEGRDDFRVVLDVFEEILFQFSSFDKPVVNVADLKSEIAFMSNASEAVLKRKMSLFLPKFRRLIQMLTSPKSPLTIFIDDLHLLKSNIQPLVLANLYAVARGNRCFIKASGIEQFSNPWDGIARAGLEPIHDAQILKLDYNLTMPDKSKEHIVGILNAQARYCGLPDINFLANENALSRLVWVAAAVPRDALSLFSLAIAKGSAKGEKMVSVTSINAAASEMAQTKLSDVVRDAPGRDEAVKETLDSVIEFCVTDHRKNAFLLEIDSASPVFQNIQSLMALRLVHVLHEGITPHRAGKRFMALMLDYGFYVGIRAARSVDLFQKEPSSILAKNLRSLPVFPI